MCQRGLGGGSNRTMVRYQNVTLTAVRTGVNLDSSLKAGKRDQPCITRLNHARLNVKTARSLTMIQHVLKRIELALNETQAFEAYTGVRSLKGDSAGAANQVWF